MSLGNARAQDAELSRLASSPDRAEQHQAYGILDTEAAAAPPKRELWANPSLLDTETEANPSMLG